MQSQSEAAQLKPLDRYNIQIAFGSNTCPVEDAGENSSWALTVAGHSALALVRGQQVKE